MGKGRRLRAAGQPAAPLGAPQARTPASGKPTGGLPGGQPRGGAASEGLLGLGPSVPEQARAVLAHFASDALSDTGDPGWAGDAHGLVAAVSAGSVSLRELLDLLPRYFVRLAVLGSLSFGDASTAGASRAAGKDPALLAALHRVVSWLKRVLTFVSADSTHPPLPAGSTMAPAARCEAVAWLVQRGCFKVLPALLFAPAFAHNPELEDACVHLLWSLCCDPPAAVGGAFRDNRAVYGALQKDNFTVVALLCWLARKQGTPRDETRSFAGAVCNLALNAGQLATAHTRTGKLLAWDVVSVSDGGAEWIQFDAAQMRMRVSAGYALRAYEAYMWDVLMLDDMETSIKQFFSQERRALAAQVARVQGAGSPAAARSHAAGEPAAGSASAAQQAAAEAHSAQEAKSEAGTEAPTSTASAASAASTTFLPSPASSPATASGLPPRAPSNGAPWSAEYAACPADGDISSSSVHSSATAVTEGPTALEGKLRAAAGGVADAGADCTPAAEPMQGAACAACGASRQDARLKACAGCRAVRYCSAACQRAHWRVHRGACKPG